MSMTHAYIILNAISLYLISYAGILVVVIPDMISKISIESTQYSQDVYQLHPVIFM